MVSTGVEIVLKLENYWSFRLFYDSKVVFQEQDDVDAGTKRAKYTNIFILVPPLYKSYCNEHGSVEMKHPVANVQKSW